MWAHIGKHEHLSTLRRVEALIRNLLRVVNDCGILTLKSAVHDKRMHWDTFKQDITAQWEGMGDVGLVRYKPALLTPCPTTRV